MQKVKLFIGIGAALVLILVAVYGILMLRGGQAQKPSPQVPEAQKPLSPPSDIEIDKSFIDSPFAYPKTQRQLDTTGATDEDLTSQELEQAVERGSLWGALPIKTDTFTITPDYTRAQYAVSFTNPDNPTNQDQFEQWLKETYPAIGLDEFILIP